MTMRTAMWGHRLVEVRERTVWPLSPRLTRADASIDTRGA